MRIEKYKRSNKPELKGREFVGNCSLLELYEFVKKRNSFDDESTKNFLFEKMLKCIDFTFWNDKFIYKIYYEKDELSYYYCDVCRFQTYINQGDGKTCGGCIKKKGE